MIAFVIVGAMALVFAFVPLVECHRCNQERQFSYDIVVQGKPALMIDYCDCASFWILGKTGKKGKISILRSLMKPQSLKMDTGDGRVTSRSGK